jgi:hypothetical protein
MFALFGLQNIENVALCVRASLLEFDEEVLSRDTVHVFRGELTAAARVRKNKEIVGDRRVLRPLVDETLKHRIYTTYSSWVEAYLR